MNFFTKTRVLYALIAILFLLNVGTLATIWIWKTTAGGPPPPPFMNEKKADRNVLIEQLNLSDEQIKKFEESKLSTREKVRNLNDEMRSLKDEYFGNISNNVQDSAMIKSLLEKISEKQKQLESETYNHFRRLRSICDDKQKEKYDKIVMDLIRMRPPPGDAPPGEPPDGTPPDRERPDRLPPGNRPDRLPPGQDPPDRPPPGR